MKKKEKEDDDQHENATRRIANNCKHKRCKTKTTKIMTKRTANSCNQEGARLKGLKYFAPTSLLVQWMFIKKTNMYNYIKSYHVNEIICFKKNKNSISTFSTGS